MTTGPTARERLHVYREGIDRTVPRLLGMIDRGPDSTTAGSLDRDHWAWKFRDHPIGYLQMGLIPLAKLYAGPEGEGRWQGRDALLQWIELGLRQTLDRQYRNGSYDSVGPFTQDHAMTLVAAWVLATVGNRLGHALPDPFVERMREATSRACRFSTQSEEDYAFISNHHALFALACHEASIFLSEPAWGTRADEVVARILEEQSEDGWFREYGGPDPGYETLGLHYLAEVAEVRDPPGLADALERSVHFLAHCVHPDGGVGGVYGSRNTRLFMPGGLERLAARLPMAEAILRRVVGAFDDHMVVTLDTVDPHNIPPLLGAWVSAAEAAASNAEAGGLDPATLPSDTFPNTRVFEDSGLVVASRAGYSAVISGKKGGVGVVHRRSDGACACTDAGYVARAGTKVWTSQVFGGSVETEADGGAVEVRVAGAFNRAKQHMVTPWNHLVLRVLNLTLFRSVALGAWLRGMIIRRIITGSEPGGIRLSRRIVLHDDRVEVRDSIRNGGGRTLDEVRISSSFMPIHMGSARYFTGDELQPEPPGFADARASGVAPSAEVELTWDVTP